MTSTSCGPTKIPRTAFTHIYAWGLPVQPSTKYYYNILPLVVRVADGLFFMLFLSNLASDFFARCFYGTIIS